METQNENEFTEDQQAIVDNIATQSFLRGKIDGLRNIEDYFNAFVERNILKADLIKAIQNVRLVLQGELK